MDGICIYPLSNDSPRFAWKRRTSGDWRFLLFEVSYDVHDLLFCLQDLGGAVGLVLLILVLVGREGWTGWAEVSTGCGGHNSVYGGCRCMATV